VYELDEAAARPLPAAKCLYAPDGATVRWVEGRPGVAVQKAGLRWCSTVGTTSAPQLCHADCCIRPDSTGHAPPITPELDPARSHPPATALHHTANHWGLQGQTAVRMATHEGRSSCLLASLACGASLSARCLEAEACLEAAASGSTQEPAGTAAAVAVVTLDDLLVELTTEGRVLLAPLHQRPEQDQQARVPCLVGQFSC
jgi:hypothetical protein